MAIAAPIFNNFGAMNKSQRAIVANTEGPLLVIAGPGSGKTFSLVLRTLNLLLLKKAEPRDLVICTFTEKVAFELLDRISACGTQGQIFGRPDRTSSLDDSLAVPSAAGGSSPPHRLGEQLRNAGRTDSTAFHLWALRHSC